MRRYFSSIVLFSIFVLFNPARLFAQPDPTLEPTFGSIKLEAGFKGDPFKKDLSAGGKYPTAIGGVNAYVSKAPEYRLNYTADKSPLTFEVESKGETTLLIRLPDGKWIANGDGLRGQIVLKEPQSGQYDIYVGTVGKDTIPATLLIAEAARPALIGKGNLPDCYFLGSGVDFFITQGALRGCQNDAKVLAAVFKKQVGTIFRKVDYEILLAQSAMHGKILGGFQKFADIGHPGDYFVLSLAGHGGVDRGYWFYTPFDYDSRDKIGSSLYDEQLFSASVKLMSQKKNVIIIADTCHSGKLIDNAEAYLKQHPKAKDGGLVLMAACNAEQTAANVGENGAFSNAVAESLTALADNNGDGKITLGEQANYAIKRTTALLEPLKHKQNSMIVTYGTLTKDSVFAVAKPLAIAAAAFAPPKLPSKYGTTPWNVTSLEARFTIKKCQIDPQDSSSLVFELDFKEDIPKPLTYQLILTDSDGVNTTYSGYADPKTGKLGGRMMLTFQDVLNSTLADKWKESSSIKIEIK